jgi:hypothetical protein
VKVVAYLTHPLTPRDPRDITARGNNVAMAVEWVRWASAHTNWAISAPWLVDVMAGHDDELRRPRALVDQMAHLVRCDVLILVGGEITVNMMVQYEFAKKRGMPIVDATVLGRKPPDEGTRPPGTRIDWTNWLISIATGPIMPLVPA